MSIAEIWFSITLNILSLYIDIKAIKIFLDSKHKNSLFTACIYFLVVSSNWLIYFFVHNSFLNTFSLVIGLFVATIVLFEGTIFRKLAAIILSVAVGCLAEEIVWRVMILSGQTEINEAVGSMLSSFVYLAIVLILERIICFKKTDYLSWTNYMNIFIVSGGSVLLVFFKENATDFSLVELGILCLINVSTYFLYDKINESYYEKMKVKVLEQQVNMYENQLTVMKQSQDAIQSLKHDMKKHMGVIQTYLKKDDCNKASEYLEEFYMNMQVARQYVNTGNELVDAVLNYYLYQADKMGCHTNLHVEVPAEQFMSDFDLNMLLSNLLENAIEALEKVDEKQLNVQISYQSEVLYISIYNTYKEEIAIKEKRIQTTKKNKKEHGIGLNNIQNVVDKYGGQKQVEVQNEMFKADIMLYTKGGM